LFSTSYFFDVVVEAQLFFFAAAATAVAVDGVAAQRVRVERRRTHLPHFRRRHFSGLALNFVKNVYMSIFSKLRLKSLFEYFAEKLAKMKMRIAFSD
jgi:hypothetical protein